MFADYFVTGCRTEKGFSVILIPRDDNVETKKIKTSYSTAAATAFIQFDNVKVPVDHLLGKEDNGFIVIMVSTPLHKYFALWIKGPFSHTGIWSGSSSID